MWLVGVVLLIMIQSISAKVVLNPGDQEYGFGMSPNKTPRKYKQIAIVVNDIEKALKNWHQMLGIGPWAVRTFNPSTVRDFHVDGKLVTEDFEFIIAVCWEGDIEWELIQPVKGPNIYWRHLETEGEGLHHVKEILPDELIPGVIADFAARGIAVTQTGWIDGDVHYYFDTKDTLGYIYELGNGGPISPATRTYP